MAESKPRNKGAQLLKKKLDKSRIDNANKRARKNTKPGSGTMSERVKNAAKPTPEKRGLPAVRGSGAATRGVITRGLIRAAGPVGALIGMTTPVGAGSDKPYGPLMKGNSTKPQTNAQVQSSSYSQNNPTQRPYDASTSPKAAPKPKARPADLRPKKVTPKAAPKAAKRTFKKPEPSFKANWKNAAPTPMQKRGGQRRGFGSLRDK